MTPLPTLKPLPEDWLKQDNMKTNPNWTPEPWKLTEDGMCVIERARVQPIISGVTPLMSQFVAFCDGPEHEANSARIVACVNACKDWQDPAEARRLLEAQAVQLAGTQAELAALRQQNKKLREILTGLAQESDNCFDDLKQLGAISRPNAMDYRKFRKQARQALDKG